MPELPEVETIRRSLLPVVTGRDINRIVIDSPTVFALPDPAIIMGRRIAAIRRRGKYLLFWLTGQAAAPV